jgi:hypothetical protein
MTGIAELYLVVTRPHSKEAWTRFRAIFQRQQGFDQTRFIVLTSLDKNRFALTLRNPLSSPRNRDAQRALQSH